MIIPNDYELQQCIKESQVSRIRSHADNVLPLLELHLLLSRVQLILDQS